MDDDFFLFFFENKYSEIAESQLTAIDCNLHHKKKEYDVSEM